MNASFPMQKDYSLKDLIFHTLSQNPNLTAKQIYSVMKKGYNINFSYQALHKTLINLAEYGNLKKEDKHYSIDENWITFLEDFIEKVKELNKKKLEVIKKLPLRETNKSIKVISFDLDGCLTDNSFDDIFWDREIPRLYARKNKLTFEDAYKCVVSEYKKLWGKVNEWRNPDFWIKHFRIEESWENIILDIKHQIKHYGDSIPVLKKLKKDYTLIITSHADRKFLNLKLKVDGLGNYFDHTFSTTNDFDSMKKDAEVYRRICKNLGIKPSSMIHIGDDYEFDYVIPTSLGIRSFLIDRTGKLKEDYVVRSLYDFESQIKDI